MMLCSGFWWFLFLKTQFWGRHVCTYICGLLYFSTTKTDGACFTLTVLWSEVCNTRQNSGQCCFLIPHSGFFWFVFFHQLLHEESSQGVCMVPWVCCVWSGSGLDRKCVNCYSTHHADCSLHGLIATPAVKREQGDCVLFKYSGIPHLNFFAQLF